MLRTPGQPTRAPRVAHTSHWVGRQRNDKVRIEWSVEGESEIATKSTEAKKERLLRQSEGDKRDRRRSKKRRSLHNNGSHFSCVKLSS